jgi:hypothetical protein
MTSPDGIVWTNRASAADHAWRSIAFGNGVFVAVAHTGIGDRVMTFSCSATSTTTATTNATKSTIAKTKSTTTKAGTTTDTTATEPDGKGCPTTGVSKDTSRKPSSTALVVSVAINCVLFIGIVVWIVFFSRKASAVFVANAAEGTAVATATNDNSTLVFAQANEGGEEIGSRRGAAPVQLTANPLYETGMFSSSSQPSPVQLTANVLYEVGGSSL